MWLSQSVHSRRPPVLSLDFLESLSFSILSPLVSLLDSRLLSRLSQPDLQDGIGFVPIVSTRLPVPRVHIAPSHLRHRFRCILL